MSIKDTIDEVRNAVARCNEGSEAELLELLLAEAEGWKMRLEEIEEEGG